MVAHTDTTIIQSAFNRHHRVLANAATEKVLALERAGVTDFERYRPLIGGGETWSAIRDGTFERGAIDMGQAAGFVDKVEPIEATIGRIIEEAVIGAARIRRHMVTPAP